MAWYGYKRDQTFDAICKYGNGSMANGKDESIHQKPRISKKNKNVLYF